MMMLHRETGTESFETGTCAGRGRLAACLCPCMEKQKEAFRSEKDRAVCTRAGWKTRVLIQSTFRPAGHGRSK